MKIKHSKYKNTGLIYELLVKQMTSDLVSRKDSPAIGIFKKFFSGDTALTREFGLYKIMQESTGLASVKADNLISAAVKAAKRLNLMELKKLKYELISEIKRNYNLEEFFSVPVTDYKTFAAFYCLLEAERSSDFVDPQSIVLNKTTLLEHLTTIPYVVAKEKSKDVFLEEFSKCDKDLRLLTFKILLEKFNKRYANLLPEQKEMLRSFIEAESPKKLRGLVNEKYQELHKELNEVYSKMPRSIEKIKIREAMKMIAEPVPDTEKNLDEHAVRVLQFQDLLHELKKR